VWTGVSAGGPVADLAQLVGEAWSVERLPVTFTVESGKVVSRLARSLKPRWHHSPGRTATDDAQ